MDAGTRLSDDICERMILQPVHGDGIQADEQSAQGRVDLDPSAPFVAGLREAVLCCEHHDPLGAVHSEQSHGRNLQHLPESGLGASEDIEHAFLARLAAQFGSARQVQYLSVEGHIDRPHLDHQPENERQNHGGVNGRDFEPKTLIVEQIKVRRQTADDAKEQHSNGDTGFEVLVSQTHGESHEERQPADQCQGSALMNRSLRMVSMTLAWISTPGICRRCAEKGVM